MHDLAHQCLCISNAPLGVGVTNQCGNIGDQANGKGDNASANARTEVLKLAAHSAETALLLHANHIHFICFDLADSWAIQETEYNLVRQQVFGSSFVPC